MLLRPRTARTFTAARALHVLVASVLAIAGSPVEVEASSGPEGDPTESGDPVGTEAPSSSAATAAILPLAVDGEVSDVDEQALADELVEGLRRGAFGVVPPADVAAADASATTCANADCVKKIAAATGATHVVRARVVLEDRDYTVSVELYDGKSGAVVASSSDNCEICGIAEAGNLMASAAATLRTKLDALAQGPATLVVASAPAGAEVRIDGELVGTTPFEAPVLAGKHVLRVSMEGFITVEREVTFVEGVRESLSFELDKVPSRLPARPWGWAALGLGIASLGTSAVFFTFDVTNRPFKVGGNCEGDNVDDDGDCAELWDPDAITYSTAIVGATLTTLGIAILLSAGKRSSGGKSAKKAGKAGKTAGRRPRFGVGAGSVMVRGRF
jgi:hypothetical protein